MAPSTPGANQVSRIDYIADATLVSNNTTIVSVNTTQTVNQQLANSGESSAAIDLKISILQTPNGKTLLAGNYSGTLTISFEPN
jgi:hypothetical protein